MDKAKKPFHEIVAEKLIKQLEAGTAPWQRPWDAGKVGAFLPYNPVTDNRYKGINVLVLLSQNRDDQRWMTYKQADEAGAQVRKGEKGTGIQYWKFIDEHNKKDDTGKPLVDKQGKPVKEYIKLERPRVFFATVFNAEQIEGLPPIQRREQTWNSIERAEAILAVSGVPIHYNGKGHAFYRPLTDSIHLPDREQFSSAENFYATALHELGHSTGHSTRLGRDLSHPFGSEGYAKEELRAEIASMILGDELGLGHDSSQHAAYVSSWIKALKDDPLEIFRAAADAEKIQSYVLGLEQKQAQELVQPNSVVLPINEVITMTAEKTFTQDQFAQSVEVIATEHSQLSSVISDDYRKAAELAKLKEELVKRDPKSTAEDISAARELRKSADLSVIIHDSDFQKKVTEIEGKPAQKNRQADKTYINVPFREKNAAKALGAEWDRGLQSWYIPKGVEQTPFSQWKQESNFRSETKLTPSKVPNDEVRVDRHYLVVPFKERVIAKALGAQWDKDAKSWYAGLKADINSLQQWLPENVQHQQAPALMPREEFSDALQSVGCIVTGDHPIMDGRKHRIATVGDKASQRAGFYVGFLDGQPAGYIQNNRTGEVLKWKAKGYQLNDEERATLNAEQATKIQQRELTQKTLQNNVASAVRELLTIAPPAPANHGYLLAKQVRPGDLRVVPEDGSALPLNSFVIIGKNWQESKTLCEANPDKLVFTAGDLLLVAQDVNGEIRSVQAIQEHGLKRFAAGGVKQDMFHVVGGEGLKALKKAPAIVIAEGYATADSISQALGYATVAAFDSGNLLNVAQQLREIFPEKPFVIAGDNDAHLELTEGKNPGKEKALAAAKAVDGTAIFPIFAPDEQSYPDNLEPVTPLTARSGNLTDEQQMAIAKMKRYTDFNDLVTNSVLGRKGLERQVTTRVNNIVDSRKEQLVVYQRQEQEQDGFKNLKQQRKVIKM